MDSNEKKTAFKTAFKGFDKSDVVEYIRQLSAKYDQEIKEKTEAAENSRALLEETEGKLSSLELKLADAVSENARLKSELDSANNRAAGLEDEISSLKERLTAAESSSFDEEKAFLESEVARLTGELSAVSSTNERAKLEIADIVIKAEQISKRIREEAVANANEEKAAIERQIVSKRSELMGISGEIERMKSVFADLYKKYVKE